MSGPLLLQGTALHLPLRDASVHCVVTSPPYYQLRDYQTATWHGGDAQCDHATAWSRGDDIRPGDKQGTSKGSRPNTQQVCARCGATRVDAQLGLEPTLEGYLAALVQVCREVWRVLRPDGTLWLNIGDTYASAWPCHRRSQIGAGSLPNGTREARPPRLGDGLKEKDLCMVPARLALALQSDGWTLRSAITLCKKAPMPESVKDRPSSATEMLYLLSKQPTYFYDAEAVRVYDGTGWHGSTCMGSYDTATKRGLGQQPREERPGRNLWNYVLLSPEPVANGHYASFPPTLADLCIRAGTSAYGCCSACGAPWARVVERQRRLDGTTPVTGTFARPEEPFRIPPNGVGHWRYSTVTTEHGWQPSCDCQAPVHPCSVLDPFCGSGTTLLVARALGRCGIGIDLSWHYLKNIARERLGLAALARWEGWEAPRDAVRYDDLPLFQEAE